MKRHRGMPRGNPMKREMLAREALHSAESAREESNRIGKLIDYGESKYGYGEGGTKYGPFVSGGFRAHWPEVLKDRIRAAHRRKNSHMDNAVRLWKKSGKRKPISFA